MKIGTFIKLAALAVAATSTAAGSVFITTKALTKVSDSKAANTDGTAPESTPDSEPTVETRAAEFEPAPFIAPPVAPVAETAPEPVIEEPVQVPNFEAMPVIEPAPAVEITPEPVIPATAVPVIDEPAASVIEEAPAEPEYTDMSMSLPYLAGKISEENADIADVIITPAEQVAKANAVAAAEVLPVEEPVIEPVAPVVETTPEPIIEPVAPVVETTPEPIIGQPEISHIETFADFNPVSMTENTAPKAEPTALPDANEVAAPITFGDISPVVEPVQVETEPVQAVVDAPAPAPVIEPAAPIPEVSAPVEKGSTVKIGDAVVSDKSDNDAIKAVVAAFNISADNLVSITAEGNMPMVFEFLYSDMRTDATLMSVYFINPEGQAILPPETDRENVLAFGRNFITGNAELKAFLA